MIPNLFIIGAAKCGTTSLHEYLAQHPEIFMARVKEPHFFAQVENTLYDYKEEFSPEKEYHTWVIKEKDEYLNLFRDGQKSKYKGESSPSYLWDPEAARKIYDFNPQAKLIVLLRDPIKRAFSHYQMDVHAGYQEKRNFYDALKEDFEMPDSQKGWNKSHLYMELGLYHQQLERFRELFSKEQIMVIRFEDFIQDIENGLKNIFEFLEVDNRRLTDIDFGKKHNQTQSPKYVFISKLKDNKVIQKMIGLIPEGLKNKIKKSTYQDGYRKDLVLDEKGWEYLIQFYQDDLKQLKKDWGISFNLNI
ncbi:sulfotransferase [Echinicola jeungdonensis]|uniref:Sulfotransferase n=2 Tax=Echinicola jeungdonensis TaxID=709343 RepID=A0ABV5J6M4_9BACT